MWGDVRRCREIWGAEHAREHLARAAARGEDDGRARPLVRLRPRLRLLLVLAQQVREVDVAHVGRQEDVLLREPGHGGLPARQVGHEGRAQRQPLQPLQRAWAGGTGGRDGRAGRVCDGSHAAWGCAEVRTVAAGA